MSNQADENKPAQVERCKVCDGAIRGGRCWCNANRAAEVATKEQKGRKA